MRRLVLFLTIVAMKWLNRILPLPVRALVRYAATNEVIACGLMDETNTQAMVIYSPQMQRDHRLGVWKNGQFTERPTAAAEPFIGQMVVKTTAVKAENGEVYRILARHMSRDKQVHSPDIVMKMRTLRRNELLECTSTETGLIWSWRKIPNEYTAMLYFLGIEDHEGRSVFGVYTRERQISYPRLNEGILFLNGYEGELSKGEEYRATLIVVDYDGWVPLVSTNVAVY